jgi:hypothetical protein
VDKRANKAALQRIRRAITRYGFFAYTVVGGSTPRWAYTIGLTESVGAELVLAGAVIYSGEEVAAIVDELARRLRHGATFDSVIHVESLGVFTFRQADRSWVDPMLLGALDYYREREVRAYQVIPDEEHATIDTPNMAEPLSATSAPIWRWLREEWPYAVPPDSTAMTDEEGWRGGRITEAARWEEDEWELFAGGPPESEARREAARSLPLATLLGHDPSLRPVLELKVGKALLRDDDDGEWEPWGEG